MQGRRRSSRRRRSSASVGDQRRALGALAVETAQTKSINDSNVAEQEQQEAAKNSRRVSFSSTVSVLHYPKAQLKRRASMQINSNASAAALPSRKEKVRQANLYHHEEIMNADQERVKRVKRDRAPRANAADKIMAFIDDLENVKDQVDEDRVEVDVEVNVEEKKDQDDKDEGQNALVLADSDDEESSMMNLTIMPLDDNKTDVIFQSIRQFDDNVDDDDDDNNHNGVEWSDNDDDMDLIQVDGVVWSRGESDGDGEGSDEQDDMELTRAGGLVLPQDDDDDSSQDDDDQVRDGAKTDVIFGAIQLLAEEEEEEESMMNRTDHIFGAVRKLLHSESDDDQMELTRGVMSRMIVPDDDDDDGDAQDIAAVDDADSSQDDKGDSDQEADESAMNLTMAADDLTMDVSDMEMARGAHRSAIKVPVDGDDDNDDDDNDDDARGGKTDTVFGAIRMLGDSNRLSLDESTQDRCNESPSDSHNCVDESKTDTIMAAIKAMHNNVDSDASDATNELPMELTCVASCVDDESDDDERDGLLDDALLRRIVGLDLGSCDVPSNMPLATRCISEPIVDDLTARAEALHAAARRAADDAQQPDRFASVLGNGDNKAIAARLRRFCRLQAIEQVLARASDVTERIEQQHQMLRADLSYMTECIQTLGDVAVEFDGDRTCIVEKQQQQHEEKENDGDQEEEEGKEDIVSSPLPSSPSSVSSMHVGALEAALCRAKALHRWRIASAGASSVCVEFRANTSSYRLDVDWKQRSALLDMVANDADADSSSDWWSVLMPLDTLQQLASTFDGTLQSLHSIVLSISWQLMLAERRLKACSS
jgi:hypothetical protein